MFTLINERLIEIPRGKTSIVLLLTWVEIVCRKVCVKVNAMFQSEHSSKIKKLCVEVQAKVGAKEGG